MAKNEHETNKKHPFTGTPEEQLPDLEGERVQSEHTDELKDTDKHEVDEE